MPFLRNPKGAVHSVTEEHLEALKVGPKGQKALPAGWEELDEAAARAAAADAGSELFGKRRRARAAAADESGSDESSSADES